MDAEKGQNIATAIAEVSERASVLVREEIELAKAEISEKATRMVRGAIVGMAAGVFVFTALFFILVGCAWLLYYVLPIGSQFTYFYGFFAMAIILLILGALAGLIAARAVKSGTPPTPTMAMEEARKIRESVSAGQGSAGTEAAAASAAAAAALSRPPTAAPAPPQAGGVPPAPAPTPASAPAPTPASAPTPGGYGTIAPAGSSDSETERGSA